MVLYAELELRTTGAAMVRAAIGFHNFSVYKYSQSYDLFSI